MIQNIYVIRLAEGFKKCFTRGLAKGFGNGAGAITGARAPRFIPRGTRHETWRVVAHIEDTHQQLDE